MHHEDASFLYKFKERMLYSLENKIAFLPCAVPL